MKSLKEHLLPPKPEGEVVNIGQRILQWNKFYTDLTARIDALEANAVKVNGSYYQSCNESTWDTGASESDTHSALLINIQPIERGVSVAEVVERLRLEASGLRLFGEHKTDLDELADRIEREGIKP